MTLKHQTQIDRYLKAQSEPLGWVFDCNDVLVGTIDDTSESSIALSLGDELLHPELYPEQGETGSSVYYSMAIALAAKGYRVIEAEWWYRKINSGHCIATLPETKTQAIALRMEDGTIASALLLEDQDALETVLIYDAHHAELE